MPLVGPVAEIAMAEAVIETSSESDSEEFDPKLLEHTDEQTNEAERNKIVLCLPTDAKTD